jgi:hypothetical protein
MQRKLLGIFSVGFGVTGQLPIIYSAIVKCLTKEWEYKKAAHPPFIYFKKVYDLVRRFCISNSLILVSA